MIEVNLHPGESGRERGGGWSVSLPDLEGIGGLDTFRSDPWHASFLVLLVLVPLLTGFLWYRQAQRAERLEGRLEEALADSARLADLRALSDSIEARREEIRDRISLVRALDQDRYAWPHLMDEISRTIPERAWLEEIRRRSGLPDLRIELSGAAASPLVITDFVRSLEDSPFVDGVRIRNSQRQEIQGRRAQAFTLSVTYRSPPASAVERQELVAGGS